MGGLLVVNLVTALFRDNMTGDKIREASTWTFIHRAIDIENARLDNIRREMF